MRGAAPPDQVRTPRLMGPPLWEILRGDRVSWLYGATSWNEVPEPILERLAGASEVVLEYDVRALTAEIVDSAMTREDGSLEEDLGPELWVTLMIETTGRDPAVVARRRPRYVLELIKEPNVDQPKTPTLKLLVDRAAAANKKLSFLVAPDGFAEYASEWNPVADDMGELRDALADLRATRAEQLEDWEA